MNGGKIAMATHLLVPNKDSVSCYVYADNVGGQTSVF